MANEPSRILCLSDAEEDMHHFTKGHPVDFFQIEQANPLSYQAQTFRAQYLRLNDVVDLSRIGLVIAEYVDSLPIVYLMRAAGFHCPAILIPHSTPYPLDTFALFLLLTTMPHPKDCVLCGSESAVQGFRGLLGMDACSVCTFGIHETHGERPPRSASRLELGLPQQRPIVLYTGRFMPDKGLREWMQVVHLIRKERPDVLPVLSATHLSPDYFNDLAPGLSEAVFFYRLQRAHLALLYRASDIYLSCATSVFETYGKSPLEAIAAGIPVVLPRWDGFQDYVSNEDGHLASVIFSPEPLETPYQFAKVDVEDCAKQGLTILSHPQDYSPMPKPWGLRSVALAEIQSLVDSLIVGEMEQGGVRPDQPPSPISAGVRMFFQEFQIKKQSLSLEGLQSMGILSRQTIGSTELRRVLHNQLFKPESQV